MNIPHVSLPRFAVTALLFVVPSLHAQRMELSDPSATAVTVESAAIKTEVTGRIAVTTFDLTFRNPNNRVLEGTFVLPLLDGQSVIRFGLDMNGTLREAVPVDKVRGRVVFEEIERRRVDPGLLEQTAGNNYRARIFPLPAHGTRRIVIAYQQDLARVAGETTYRLNLDFPERLKKFQLAVSAYSGGTPARLQTTLPLTLPGWRDGEFLEVEQSDFLARGLLELVLPPAERPRVLTGRFGAEEYFYAEVPVKAAAKPRPAPHVVGLVWDSSASGRERDHPREFAFLDAWFKAVGDVEVRLTRLSETASGAGNFKIKSGNWSSLRRELERTIYDGATSLDGLTDDRAVDEWLLFSDGLINFGATPRSAALPLHGAVHVILASPKADPSWLRGFAARHGGEFVNLLESPPALAASQLRAESVRVLAVDHDPEVTAQIFPEAGTPVIGDAIVVTGILRRGDARISLRLGHDEADARDVEVAVRSGENPTALAARGWAATKIGFLAIDAGANRDDIRRTSREFGLVSADSSLIVLESVNDYVRYDIAPPAELRAEWDARRGQIAVDLRKDRDRHLAGVVAAFQARVAWWEKTYPKGRPPVDPPSKKGDRDAAAFFPAPVASAPLSSRLGPPPPAEAAAAKGDDVVQLEAFSVTTAPVGGAARASARAQNFSAAGSTSLSFGSGGGVTLAAAGSISGLAARTDSERAAPEITLQRWSPNAGYLDRLRRAPKGQRYSVYLEERAAHSRQPGFFLDVANYFFAEDDAATALKILSNLAELDLEDVPLLRVLAHRLTQADRPDLAQPLFERVLTLRPDEPQSRRDLALACADLKQYQRAVDLLAEIVAQPWDARFPEIELIALSELNAIAATCGQKIDLGRVDPRLRRNLPVATRVTLTWDANDCDIDLWVTDPNGEVANYSHTLTHQGGHLSRDFTAGYGPEEFILRAPKPGDYRVQIDYFGDSRPTALGPVTAQIRLITGFGTPGQTEKRTTVRLDNKKQNLEIGSFSVPGKTKELHASAWQ